MALFFRPVHGLTAGMVLIDRLLPLYDYKGNKYATPEQISQALAEKKQLGEHVQLTDGKDILEALQGEECQAISSMHVIRGELIALGRQMSSGDSVLVTGWPLVCQGRQVDVYSGYGLSVRGHPWAITDANIHVPPPPNLLVALLRAGVVTEEYASAWRTQPPNGCGRPHFKTM